MRVSKVNNNTPNFKGGLNNKALLRGLEKISDHGATFSAATMLLMSTFVRPFAISLTPKTDKENKQYAQANSLASGLVKFGIAAAVALPVENAVKKINLDPKKFLKEGAIKDLIGNIQNISDAKNYKFATQIIKLMTSFITAIPKSVITVALIPLIMDFIFKKKAENKASSSYTKKEYDPVFKPVYEPNFKGGFTKGVSSILNNKAFRNFAVKHSSSSQNAARNVSIATDILLTGATAIMTKKSKKIKEARKNPLIYNGIISTGMSLGLGVGLDSLTKLATRKFVEAFKKANLNDPKLAKYIEGINIIRPSLLFGLVYYGILPIISVFGADKIDKLKNKKS